VVWGKGGMHRHRFYIYPDSIIDNNITITKPEYHHIVDVLRYKTGQDIILFDGKGSEYQGRIKTIDKNRNKVEVSIGNAYKETNGQPLILAAALLRAVNMDLLIKKATELGVTHIYPLITDNVIVKIPANAQAAKINKWRRISTEAGKQSQRNWLPYIDKIWDFQEALCSLETVETKIICTGGERAKPLRDLPDTNARPVAVMIGPEGGFSPGELDLAGKNGFMPVRLGNAILRAETAAVTALSIVNYKFGYWG